MRPHPSSAFGAAALLRAAFALLLGVAALSAAAQEDPPGRVGRIAELNGSVSWWDDEAGQWADAERNRPLTTGDRISTAASGRAELRVGSTVLRLSNSTEVELRRIDDERIVVQLHSGALALRVRSREVADEIELVTDEAVMRPLTAGHYRVDRIDDSTRAAVWRGDLRIDDSAGFVVAGGQAVELYRSGRRDAAGELRSASRSLPADGFTEWVLTDDGRDERTASSRYVSPEMTGAEELDRAGRWDQHPEYGAIWLPLSVHAGWAPYRYGRWTWVSPWGWTWIDDAPWGFAPFHYGRWVSWSGRWGWVPGAYVVRPVYAPALVAWLGGGSWGVSVQIGGGGPVGWVPLAPREVFRPHYRHSPRYVDRVNPHPPYRWQHPPGQPPREPVSYGNQGVPNGVTVVPRDVLQRRQPIGRAVIEPSRDGRGGPGRSWQAAEPPAPPTHGLIGGGRRVAPGQPLATPRDERGPRDQREQRDQRDQRDQRGQRGPWGQRDPVDPRPPQGGPHDVRQPGRSVAPQLSQPPSAQQPAVVTPLPERGFGERAPNRGEGIEREAVPQRQPDRVVPGAPLAVPGVVVSPRGHSAPAERAGDRERQGDRGDRDAHRDGGRDRNNRDAGRGNRDGAGEAPALRTPAAPAVPAQPVHPVQPVQPVQQSAPAARPPAAAPVRQLQPVPQPQPQAQPQPQPQPQSQPPAVAPRAPVAEPPRERARGGDDDRRRNPEGPRDRRERESVR